MLYIIAALPLWVNDHGDCHNARHLLAARLACAKGLFLFEAFLDCRIVVGRTAVRVDLLCVDLLRLSSVYAILLMLPFSTRAFLSLRPEGCGYCNARSLASSALF